MSCLVNKILPDSTQTWRLLRSANFFNLFNIYIMNKQKRKIVKLQANAVRKMLNRMPENIPYKNNIGVKHLGNMYALRGKNYRPFHAYQIASRQKDGVLASVFRDLKKNECVEEGIPLWHWGNMFDIKKHIIRRFIGDFNDGTLVSP